MPVNSSIESLPEALADRLRLRAERNGVVAAAIDAGVRLYEAHDTQLHPRSVAGLRALAATDTHSRHDAAYLAVAAELKIPLVTFDHKLGGAAVEHLGALA